MMKIFDDRFFQTFKTQIMLTEHKVLFTNLGAHSAVYKFWSTQCCMQILEHTVLVSISGAHSAVLMFWST